MNEGTAKAVLFLCGIIMFSHMIIMQKVIIKYSAFQKKWLSGRRTGAEILSFTIFPQIV